MNKFIKYLGVTVLALLATSCNTNPQPTTIITPQKPVTNNSKITFINGIPLFTHEVVVVLENHFYDQVRNSSDMPFLNSLIQQYSSAANYYANTHPSIGNYFMLTTGQVISNNDNFSGTVSTDNIVRRLTTAGKTWRVYAENLPKTGYLGPGFGEYAKKHNPFAYFSDVRNNPDQAANIVPFSLFISDISSNSLPNFSFVVPDLCDDAHDCSLGVADNWLKKNISPLLTQPYFRSNSLVVITFDEGTEGDYTHGGNHIVTILAGFDTKTDYQSANFYQHQNLLRTLLDGLGIRRYPGQSASTTDMSDLFRQ